MDKLTLEHLAPYLPYGLKLWHEGHKATNILETDIPTGVYNEMSIFTMYSMTIGSKFLKPILRPLSDLTKEIEHKGETFVPIHRILEAYCFDLSKMNEFEILEYVDSLIEIDMSYMTAKMLLEWHFDVFRLIYSGLAIDINTLTDAT